MNGKGDSPRPLSVPATTFADRWAATFGPPKAPCDHPRQRWVVNWFATGHAWSVRELVCTDCGKVLEKS